MASYFFSDIHLKPNQDPRGKALRAYLSKLPANTERVFFLGDIFDFWMGGQLTWVDRYFDFVEGVKELLGRGIEVYFFEGNHDIHIDPYFEKIGVKVFTDPQVMNLHGKKVRIEHGDFFNPDDIGYLRLRAVLRSPILRWLALRVPGWVITAIADPWSAASHRRTSVEGRRPEVVADIQRRSRIYLDVSSQKQDFDMLIMGHTHVREDFETQVNGKNLRFINLGSWFEAEPQAFVLSDRGSFYEKVPLGVVQ